MKYKKMPVGMIAGFGFVASMAMVLSSGCARTADEFVGSSNQSTIKLGENSETVEVAVNPNAQTVRIGEIDWYVDYEDAMAAAQASNRPVWLHFGENPG